MKKFILAAVSCALVLSMAPAAQAKWVKKSLRGVGLSIDVNSTFKVTKNTKKEADLEGTIFKKQALIILTKDSSIDWSTMSDPQILKALTSGTAHAFKNFKVDSQGKATIGSNEGHYAAFDATVDGHPMHGYMQFAVAEGALYNAMMVYQEGNPKVDDVASKMIGSMDFTH